MQPRRYTGLSGRSSKDQGLSQPVGRQAPREAPGPEITHVVYKSDPMSCLKHGLQWVEFNSPSIHSSTPFFPPFKIDVSKPYPRVRGNQCVSCGFSPNSMCYKQVGQMLDTTKNKQCLLLTSLRGMDQSLISEVIIIPKSQGCQSRKEKKICSFFLYVAQPDFLSSPES